MEISYRGKVAAVVLTAGLGLAGCFGYKLRDHGQNHGKWLETDPQHAVHQDDPNYQPTRRVPTEPRGVSPKLTQPAEQLREDQIEAVSETRQEAQRAREGYERAEAAERQVADLSAYEVVDEFRLLNVVTQDDQTDDKSAYVVLKPLQGSEVVELRYQTKDGEKALRFNVNELTDADGNVRVYLSDLGVDALPEVGVSFFGRKGQEDDCFICPGAQPKGYVHEDGRLQAEHADAERSERFLAEIGAHGRRVAQTSAHYRAEASQAFHGFRTAHETDLQSTASELVGREADKFKEGLEGMNGQVKSTLDKARESHSRWRQELEQELEEGE